MAKPLISDGQWERIAPLPPPHPPRPKEGRPPRNDRRVLTDIVFILKTGIPWEDLPLKTDGLSIRGPSRSKS